MHGIDGFAPALIRPYGNSTAGEQRIRVDCCEQQKQMENLGESSLVDLASALIKLLKSLSMTNQFRTAR